MRPLAGWSAKPIAEVLGQDDTAIFDVEGASMVMTHDRQVMDVWDGCQLRA